MQSLHYFFLLAPDYDELVIPSSFAEFAPDSQKRNVAKAFQYFIAKNDFSVFQRQPRESPEEWSQRLSSECGLGAFAEYVSPPRQIRAKNGRFYEGNTALLLMRRADENTMRNVLLVTAILSDLDRERNYDISSILDCVPEPFHSACRPVLEEIGVVLESSGGVLSGEQWKAWLPAGTIQKAQEWCDRSECPAFFGEPPPWLSCPSISNPSQETGFDLTIKEPEFVFNPSSLTEDSGEKDVESTDDATPTWFSFSPVLALAVCLVLGLVGILYVGMKNHQIRPLKGLKKETLMETQTYPFDIPSQPKNESLEARLFIRPMPPGV